MLESRLAHHCLWDVYDIYEMIKSVLFEEEERRDDGLRNNLNISLPSLFLLYHHWVVFMCQPIYPGGRM